MDAKRLTDEQQKLWETQVLGDPQCQEAMRRDYLAQAGHFAHTLTSYDIAAYALALEDENQRLKEQLAAAHLTIDSALAWFRQFGYNPYGVVCQDDVADHEPVMTDLAAIAVQQKRQSNEQ